MGIEYFERPVNKDGYAVSKRRTPAPFVGNDGPNPNPHVEKCSSSAVTVFSSRLILSKGIRTQVPERSSNVTKKGSISAVSVPRSASPSSDTVSSTGSSKRASIFSKGMALSLSSEVSDESDCVSSYFG